MQITIHRGAHQIGGTSVEISTAASRVFIDIGDDLPGADAPPFEAIDGLTTGRPSGNALFLTHYHGDHIGRLDLVLPEISVYMGETAKNILLNITKRVDKEGLSRVERISAFRAAETVRVGDIDVTPLMIDHSAFDAYMFIIEADGKRILHTGDFRTHGFRGGKTAKMLSHYARDIDCIISEGTMLSRPDEKVATERDIENEAARMMREHKYVFALCSSANIDRIAAFCHASRTAGRIFVCDTYQYEQLETVRAAHAEKSKLYDFGKIYRVGRKDSTPQKLFDLMGDKGFCMLIRKGDKFKPFLDEYNDGIVIYSMWQGYLHGKTADAELVNFLAPYEVVNLHTSGHATATALQEIYTAVKPKTGIIPVHTEKPEAFMDLFGTENVILISDGETLEI
jgi:ribonuclease J